MRPKRTVNLSLNKQSNEQLIEDLSTPLKFKSTDSLDEKSEEENEEEQSDVKDISDHNSMSFISSLLFHWVKFVINISNQKSLKLSHFVKFDQSKPVITQFNCLYTSWYGTPMKNNGYDGSKGCCPLFKAIIRANWVDIFIVVFLSLLLTVTRLTLIYCMRNFIQIFRVIGSGHITSNDNEESDFSDTNFIGPSISSNSNIGTSSNTIPTPLNWGYMIYILAGLILLNKLIVILLNAHTDNLSERLGIKATTELSSLIYEKVMRTGAFLRNELTEGELINYVQVDVETLGFLFFYAPLTLVVPFQFAVSIYMLYNFFGYAFTFGLITFFIMFVIAWTIQRLYITNQRKLLKNKDKRMQMTSNTFHILKVLKMYCWEEHFIKRVDVTREEELKSMQKIQNVYVLSNLVHWAIPLFLSMTSIGAYTLIHGKMPIENILTAIQIFDSLSYPLYRLPIFITSLLNTFISMKRIEKMLLTKDIEVSSSSDENLKQNGVDIKFSHCNFGITNDKKSGGNKVLLHDINIEINKGDMVAILGETGSGKSFLGSAILNALDYMPSTYKGSDPIINVINGTIGYAPQLPWIMNESIRNNILFYSKWDKKKYLEILSLCQLKRDLDSLPGGDMTEVSSNGTNISGGQKARISLARAIYTNADIYLFDDPISSVDSIISFRIFNQVLVNYLKGKTRILIKHDIQNLHMMNKIIYMDQGKILWSGSFEEFKVTALYSDLQKKSYNKNDEENIKVFRRRLSSFNSTEIHIQFGKEEEKLLKGKLLREEEQKEGKISTSLYNKFFVLMGGYIFIAFLIFLNLTWEGLNISGNMWLMKWASKVTNIDNLYYFLIYCQIGFFSLLFLFVKEFLLSRATITVNRTLHYKMFKCLMYAPINLFHDIVPMGQSINRLTNDLEKTKLVIKLFNQVLKANATLLGSIFVCSRFNLYSLIFAPILFYIGTKLTTYYINAGRDLNRLEGISKSPIVTSFSETIKGINTIRSYKTQSNFIDKFFTLQNNRYIIALFKHATTNWYVIHLELSSFLYLVFIVIFACVFKDNFNAQAIALMLKYSIQFSENIVHAFEDLTNIEKAMVCYERCDSYTKIVQERSRHLPKDKDLHDWPSKGEIVFSKYSVRYRPETECILHKIDIKIQAGEKIGIVGRSGSGKSTMFLTLFRLIEPLGGNIHIDGIDITTVGLKKLRKSICIVPQEPTLIEGTLKDNLDPLHKHSDQEMLRVLKELEFFDFMTQGKKSVDVGLGMKIKEFGNNLSLGEKQLLCFARAILTKTKIIILDEATASVDQNTEEIIQRAIDRNFKRCTVLTIAHRVKTVLNCNRIIVLDQGIVAEFDTPSALLQKANGHFARLYYKNMQAMTNGTGSSTNLSGLYSPSPSPS